MSEGSFFSGIVEGSGFAVGEAIMAVVVVAIAVGFGMSRDSFLEALGHKLARLFRRPPIEAANGPEQLGGIGKSRWLSWLSGVLVIRFAIWLFITGFTGFFAWNYFLLKPTVVAATAIGPIAWNRG
jgi:hypothetical protein